MILLLPGVPSPASRTLCIFIYYFHFYRIYFHALLLHHTSVSDLFLYLFPPVYVCIIHEDSRPVCD